MLKVWRELSWWWVLACLIVLAMEDIRDGWLSMPVIGILGITGIAGVLLLGRRPSLLPGLIILGAGFFFGREDRIWRRISDAGAGHMAWNS